MKDKNETKKKKPKDIGIYLSVGLVLLSFVALFLPYSVLDNVGSENYKIKISSYDGLGEFVGGITAPFLSLAAFILLYLTYNSQKEELSTTQDILKEQNTTQQTQRFETHKLTSLPHKAIYSVSFGIFISLRTFAHKRKIEHYVYSKKYTVIACESNDRAKFLTNAKKDSGPLIEN